MAVAEYSGPSPWTPNQILCSNIVPTYHIGDTEAGVMSLLPQKDFTQSGKFQALAPFYVSLDQRYVGVIISEITFQLKLVRDGAAYDINVSQATEISGWLHFKCE